MRSIGEMLDYEMMQYGMIVLIDQGVRYYQRYQEGQLREAQLQTRLAQSQFRPSKCNSIHTFFSILCIQYLNWFMRIRKRPNA